MADVQLEDRILPIEEAMTEGRLAVSLILKLIAGLRATDTIDDEAFGRIAKMIIAELGSDQERFRAWGFFEETVEGFRRPDDEHHGDQAGHSRPE